MRRLIHTIAIGAAILTLLWLIPSIRTGETSVIGGLVRPTLVLALAYAAIIAVVGSLCAVPLAQWPSLLKQLFRGHGET